MRLAQIILPWEAGEVAHQGLKNEIMDEWGGYTAVSAQGGWRDYGAITRDGGTTPDVDHIELVMVYHVAMQEHEAERRKLCELASKYARIGRQKCVMAVSTAGRVHMVDAQPMTAAERRQRDAETLVAASTAPLPAHPEGWRQVEAGLEAAE